MLIKFFILFIVLIILSCILVVFEQFNSPVNKNNETFIGGEPPPSDGCNMEPQMTCNPENTNGKCNWIDGACISIANDEDEDEVSLPQECLILPNYLLTHLRDNYTSSDPMINIICSIPREIIQSVEDTGLTEQEKIRDIICIAKYLSGGVSACPQDNCFYNLNIAGNCRSNASKNFLISLQSQNQSNTVGSAPAGAALEQRTPEKVEITVPAKVQAEYSDQDCKTLRDRGFDVVCTYNDNRNNESVFHLDREIDTQKKRYVFFND